MKGDLLHDFYTEGLDLRNTVVRCADQAEADIFLGYLCLKGVYDARGIKVIGSQWERHGSATCYHFSRKSWCYDSWYEKEHPEYDIVDFCDIYKGYCLQETESLDCAIGYDEIMSSIE